MSAVLCLAGLCKHVPHNINYKCKFIQPKKVHFWTTPYMQLTTMRHLSAQMPVDPCAGTCVHVDDMLQASVTHPLLPRRINNSVCTNHCHSLLLCCSAAISKKRVRLHMHMRGALTVCCRSGIPMRMTTAFPWSSSIGSEVDLVPGEARMLSSPWLPLVGVCCCRGRSRASCLPSAGGLIGMLWESVCV